MEELFGLLLWNTGCLHQKLNMKNTKLEEKWKENVFDKNTWNKFTQLSTSHLKTELVFSLPFCRIQGAKSAHLRGWCHLSDTCVCVATADQVLGFRIYLDWIDGGKQKKTKHVDGGIGD